MAIDRSRRGIHFRSIPALIGIIAIASGAPEGRADRIELRGGGQIRGKVVPDPEHPDRVTVVPATGKTPLHFQKGQVLRVIAEPGALDGYVERRARVEPTAESHFELGLWCERNQLQDLAEVHYEAALDRDKAFAPAHRKLGHVLHGDRWIWGDELREAQGLVRYKGQWISKQEKENREAKAANGAEQASWVRRLKLLRQSLASGPDDRRREAEMQLMEIRDPVAVTPLVQVLGDGSEPLRTLLDHILALIPGPEATAALVSHILAETDFDVRHVTLEALTNRKDPQIIPSLVQALRSANPAVVNRSAWSLGQLNAVGTVPRLIPALISTRSQVVMSPPSGVSSGGNFGAGFGAVAPTPAPGRGSYGSVGNTYYSYGLLTPPAVAPGAVAFGAVAAPLPLYSSSGFSVGGGVTGSRGPIPRVVTLRFQNVEVLATLIKLTGRDFGYDIPAWQRWVASSFHPDPAPARVVPQP